MTSKIVIAVCLVALAIGTASAKGPFQAQGAISDVHRDGEDIIFRFSGSMSLDYATATSADPRNEWKMLTFTVSGLTVRITNWTKRHEPSVRAHQPDIGAVFANLSRLATSHKTLTLALDNPSLTFSNRGELVAIAATYVYVIESPSVGWSGQ